MVALLRLNGLLGARFRLRLNAADPRGIASFISARRRYSTGLAERTVALEERGFNIGLDRANS
jgi:hypothetical protein